MSDESARPTDMSAEEVQRIIVLLLTSRNDSRAHAFSELRREFPESEPADLPTVTRNLRNTLVGLLEFVQALRERLHEESPEWDEYFAQVIQRFALDQT